MVDLLDCPDLEAAAGAVGLALESPTPSPRRLPAVSREVLVVGGGVGGCQAAIDLANAGFKVYLAETSLSIGGTMAQLDKTFPTLDCSICILGPKLVEVAAHPDIELLTYASLDRIAGSAGHFEIDLTLKPRYVNMSKCVGCGTCATVLPGNRPQPLEPGLKTPEVHPDHLCPGGAAAGPPSSGNIASTARCASRPANTRPSTCCTSRRPGA